MDFLWLRNLSIIKNTIKIIRARFQTDKDYENKLKSKWIDTSFVEKYFKKMGFYPPLDDSYVYESIFQKGNTSGIFQFESDWMRRWLVQLKPYGFYSKLYCKKILRRKNWIFTKRYLWIVRKKILKTSSW